MDAQDRRTEFRELVDELAELEDRRAGADQPDRDRHAARRVQIERRLLELLQTDLPSNERRGSARLLCDLPVRLATQTADLPATVVDIGTGGLGIASDAVVIVGQRVQVTIERMEALLEAPLRVRGRVAWLSPSPAAPANIGIVLARTDDSGERRLRRFVIELLRSRLPWLGP